MALIELLYLARLFEGKRAQEAIFLPLNRENCCVYLRPNSSVCQYSLSIDGEGIEHLSTDKKNLEDAKEFVLNRKLKVMACPHKS